MRGEGASSLIAPYFPLLPHIENEPMSEMGGLLDLIYGEDCMMGRQILRLEEKMVSEKTAPRSEVARRVIKSADSSEKRFWGLARERFGISREDKGHKREDRGK